MKQFRSTLLLTVAAVVSSSFAFGQVATGSISGTATDSNGAAIPGATITAKNDATGVETRTLSSDAGVFLFPTLETGMYTVTGEKVGFKKLVRSGLEIRLATRQELDLRFEIGEVQQTVEVTGEAPLLETTSTQRGQNLSTQFVNNLPFYFGGIRSPRAFVGYMQGANSGPELSVSGSNGRSQEVLMDGASFTIPESGGTSFNPPAAEIFDEFKMLTQYDAEYGRAGGGIELYHSKSGTNEIHGTSFLNMRRDIWNANSWANNRLGTPRAKERTNEIGGAAGGPIFIPKVYDGRNKSFFYFTYTQILQPASISQVVNTVPTVRMKNGDFGELPASQIIYDPTTTSGPTGSQTRTPFPNQIIPRSRFSSISNRLLSAIPDPTRPGIASNYDFVNLNQTTDPIWSLKFDHAITTNHRLAFLVTKDNQLSDLTTAFNGPLGQGLKTYQRPDNWRFNYDWVIKPNLLFHATYGYSRTRQVWNNPNQDGAGSAFGFPGLTGDADAMPRVVFLGADGFTPWGVQDGKVDNGYQNNITKMFTGSMNWIKGKHEFKFGGDIRRLGTDATDWAGTNGLYNFARTQTALPTNLANTGNAFASLLLGAVDSANRTATPVPTVNIKYQYYAGYFQDTYRLNSRLTLTLGMRYDVAKNWMVENGDYSSIDLSRPNPAAGNRNGAYVFYGSGAGREGVLRPYPTDYTNWGPRLGFAYKLGPKTVLRGGYAIYYQAQGNGGCGCRIGFANPIAYNSDGLNSVLNWDNGISPPPGFRPPPTIDPTVAALSPNGAGSDVDYLSKNFGKAPRIPSWSVNVQHEIAKFVVEVGYVGNRGRYMNSTVDLNQLPVERLSLGSLLQQRIDSPAVIAAGFTKPYASFPDSQTLAQALRPYPQYLNVSERNAGVGRTWYDALQTRVDRRFGDFQLSATYVWSKSLQLDTFRQIFSQTNVYPQDAYNQNENKSFSYMDQPHVFNLLYSWNLPFGRGKKWLSGGSQVVDWVVGGWSLSGIQQYRSHNLIQVVAPNTIGNGVIFSRYKKPNIGTGPIRTGLGRGDLDPNDPNALWFNAAAFTIPGQYELGNSAMFYSDFRNPPVFNELVSVVKRTNFRYMEERGILLTYRLDINNLLNRTNFGNINGTIGNANFGRATAPQTGARIITMGLRINF